MTPGPRGGATLAPSRCRELLGRLLSRWAAPPSVGRHPGLASEKSEASSLERGASYQLRLAVVPVLDDQLACRFPALARDRVADLERDQGEPLEHPPDLGVVVDGQHHLALGATHPGGHALVLLERELHAITLRLPVGRVEIVQSRRTVIALDHLMPRTVLDNDVGQAQVDSAEFLLDPQQVKARAGAAGHVAEALSLD